MNLTITIASLAAVTACSGASPARPDAAADARIDAPPPIDARPDAAIDAPPANLGCLGQGLPTTAPDPLPVAGTVFAIDHYQVTPVAGASVVLHRRSNDASIGTTTSGSDGTFALAVQSGGSPVDAYLTVAAAGYPASKVDPGDPLSGGDTLLLAVAHADEIARWYTDAAQPPAPGARTLLAITVDCAGAPLGGGTIAAAPASPIIYYDDVAKQWDPGEATSTNGYALITAAPASTAVTATWHGLVFPPRPIAAPAASLTISLVTPR